MGVVLEFFHDFYFSLNSVKDSKLLDLLLVENLEGHRLAQSIVLGNYKDFPKIKEKNCKLTFYFAICTLTECLANSVIFDLDGLNGLSHFRIIC